MSIRHTRGLYGGISKTILVIAFMAIFIGGAGIVHLAAAQEGSTGDSQTVTPPAGDGQQLGSAGNNEDNKDEVGAKAIAYTLTMDSWTYGETAKTPSVAWAEATTELKEGTDYEFKYSTAEGRELTGVPTAAGSYKVAVKSLKTEFTLEDKTADFEIKKAQLEKPSLKTVKFAETEKEISVELVGFDDKTMTREGDLKGTKVGKYTATVALKDTANYEWKDKTTDKVELAWSIVPAYKVVEGAEQVFVLNKSEEACFKIDAEFDLFAKEVLIDGVKIDDGYTAEKGSTVITLSKEFVESLEAGEHTFVANFTDGGWAETTFTVAEAEVAAEDAEAPKTGDNIVVYLAVAALATMSLAGAVLYLNKNKR